MQTNLRWALALSIGLAVGLCARFALAAPGQLPAPRMSFLDNGEVRIGVDLALGGAVTFLSAKGHPGNLINSADLGRQIQMSHYSGPWPCEPGGRKPNPAWAGLGWNPIQTGDCYMNPSQTLEHRNDGKELYVKCVPMLWPHNNVPAECVFETWTVLEGPAVRMRFRCTNRRADATFYRPCPQELPAVYTVSKLSRLVSYTGSRPFTGDRVAQVTNDWRKPWPWTRFVATEGWAALVNEGDWGLGVYKADGAEFHGGLYGDERSDDSKHGTTAYVAPIHTENFDHNIVYEHRAVFVVGKLDNIRNRFNAMAVRTPPAWRFNTDRQHWTLRQATDQGFPLRGRWNVRFQDGEAKPRLESPVQCWRAEDAPVLTLRLAAAGGATVWRVFWRRLDADSFDEQKSVRLEVRGGGPIREYRVELAASAEYKGLLTGLAIEPVEPARTGQGITIESVVLSGGGGS